MTELPRVITIQSDLMTDGTYGISICEGMDTVRAMSPHSAYKHAQEVLKAAQRAEYDAAIFLQITETLRLPPDEAGRAVGHLRKKRKPLDDKALSPIGLEPGATTEGKPFLVLSIKGERVGQRTPQDARDHALVALELAEAVSIDNAYYRYLKSDWELSDTAARGMVWDIINHRYEGDTSNESSSK